VLDGGPGVAPRAEPRLPWLDDAGLACIREGDHCCGSGDEVCSSQAAG